MEKIAYALLGTLLVSALTLIFVPEDWLVHPPTTSVEVTLQRTYAQRLHGAGPGDPDRAVFRFYVSVAPVGGDIYLDGDATPCSSARGGFAWSFSPESGRDSFVVDGAVVAASGAAAPADFLATPGKRRFLVRDGDSRTFAITVALSALADSAAAGIRLDAVHWRGSPDASDAHRVALDPDEFSTQTVALFTR